MPRNTAVSDETLAEYAARLEDGYRSYPSWHTSYYLDEGEPTHVELFAFTEYPANLVDKSNFQVARDLIRSAADEGRLDTKVSDAHVIEVEGHPQRFADASVLYVQVYEDDGKTYTAAFREGVALAEYARYEYPLLDEDDHSELEHEVFIENLREALAEARGEYPFDTSDDWDAIEERASEDLFELKYDGTDGEVSWLNTAEVYARHRDAHFAELANEHYNAPLRGQLALAVAGA
jgi:hypothetical protein